jgi:hypothetical protein
MTITINLPKPMEHNFEEAAKSHGMSAADYALDVLQKEAESARLEKKRRALEFIDSWKDITPEEEEEYRRAWEFLRTALDEDRLSPNRPHFPEGSSL